MIPALEIPIPNFILRLGEPIQAGARAPLDANRFGDVLLVVFFGFNKGISSEICGGLV